MKTLSLVLTGCAVGSLTGSVGIFPIAGLLCEYGLDGKGFDGGWPAIFYIFGKLVLSFCFANIGYWYSARSIAQSWTWVTFN